ALTTRIAGVPIGLSATTLTGHDTRVNRASPSLRHRLARARAALPADWEFGPPHAELGWTLTGRRPVPPLWTIQSELCTSGVTCRENTISFPCATSRRSSSRA